MWEKFSWISGNFTNVWLPNFLSIYLCGFGTKIKIQESSSWIFFEFLYSQKFIHVKFSKCKIANISLVKFSPITVVESTHHTIKIVKLIVAILAKMKKIAHNKNLKKSNYILASFEITVGHHMWRSVLSVTIQKVHFTGDVRRLACFTTKFVLWSPRYFQN